MKFIKYTSNDGIHYINLQHANISNILVGKFSIEFTYFNEDKQDFQKVAVFNSEDMRRIKDLLDSLSGD